MVQTLIVYDLEGHILSTQSGQPTPRIPVGVPSLLVEIPKGKYAARVDVSVTPHQVILEDIPKSETQLLNERLEATEQALVQIMLEGGI